MGCGEKEHECATIQQATIKSINSTLPGTELSGGKHIVMENGGGWIVEGKDAAGLEIGCKYNIKTCFVHGLVFAKIGPSGAQVIKKGHGE